MGMAQRQVAGMWNAKGELPIEIDAGREYRYHSIFACPILRQQGSDQNPPMKLVCGHVISRDALNKLSSGNNRAIRTGSVARLKCPYCPWSRIRLKPSSCIFENSSSESRRKLHCHKVSSTYSAFVRSADFQFSMSIYFVCKIYIVRRRPIFPFFCVYLLSL